jgi:3-vinyl bacteriochlorophyllide hydratase
MALYTSEQLERRNASRWTRVQVVLAPIQFLAFLISFGLVVRFLTTGQGYAVANASVLVKIGLLWAITVTGMVWEKEVFGRYFLARAFLWEDLGNAVAMLTHNVYFVARTLHWSDRATMLLMLLAYCSYLVNCAQFVRRGMQAGRQRRQANVPQQGL